MWSTQVRFFLPELLFEVIFVLNRKGGISQGDSGGKAMLSGRSRSVERDPRAGAHSEVEELEGAARSRSRTVERGRAVRSWSRSGCNKFGKLCLLLYKNSV